MITPQTHPQYFNIELVGDTFEYYTPIYHSVGLKEDTDDAQYRAWREIYKAERPNEVTDGKIAQASYEAWGKLEESNSKENIRKTRQAVAKFLFIPKTIGAPSPDTEEFWYLVSEEQYDRVKSFTKPKSQSNTNGQANSALNSTNSPDGLTTDALNLNP